MLLADYIRNNIKICIIWINLEIIILYMLYLYKFYPSKYNKYNFLILLINIAENIIGIYII